jgi:protocatechuate 3,4-dioxygenase beta subunit
MSGNAGWYLKAIVFDGEDVTDSGIEFTPGRAYEGLQVIFSQKTTDLSGLVTDDRNKPVLDATVVIFPANQDKWTYQSRYIRSLRPDTNGKYSIKSLPPLDDYRIIAVQNLEPGQGADPDFLTRAREEAKSFSLNEGETKAFDIKLSKLVPYRVQRVQCGARVQGCSCRAGLRVRVGVSRDRASACAPRRRRAGRQPPGAPGRGQRPMRAQPQRVDAPRGTSIMRGQIVAADSGSPIRRAQVRVTSPDAREGRVATTDQQGRFEFKELPAGRYTMTASKGGFVSLQYGQRRPSESGTPIELGDGQTMEKIAIALPRGSVLGGRITDEFGEPVANASVSAWRYAYAGGARRMMPAGQNARDTTDDQGHFRLFGLPPGDYYVSATLRSGGPEVTDPMGELSGYAATVFSRHGECCRSHRVSRSPSRRRTRASVSG